MPGQNLTRDEARARARSLTVDSYDVTIDLTPAGDLFASTTVIGFGCTSAGGSTFVDLLAPIVREITLNDRPLDPADVYDGARIRLDDLAEHNVVRVVADCAYMNTGEGLHRFVDPVDDEVYLYSQFEVADARRMYAVFEQPDLKATFALTVTAPAHWQVISNAPTPEPDRVADGVARWRFTRTPRLSSYVTALVAGPYTATHGEYVDEGRKVPLAVYCRRSLAEFLDGEDILELTRQGLEFFERLFDYPYPFEKYDQLFVPEFNAGAMENAACVTIRDDYIFRSKVPDAAYERRAETILHELAHMWFGDLVTMTWWDDLWLNESFATYVSVLCQAQVTRWDNAWTTFANAEKTWAYRQDQLPSSHPIAADIRDLDDVEVNFDGITYAKGASVLKQLVAWVGEEKFFEGIRRYFRTFEWRNTTLPDLLDKLQETSGRDLRAWSSEWLQTVGVNTLRPVVEMDSDSRFTSVAVVQEAPADRPTLRSHRLAIGLYQREEGQLIRRDRMELDVSGPRTEVTRLAGTSRPDVLLLNDDDLTYAKIRLDDASLRAVLAGVGDFRASLPRSLCWAAAWDMTRDAEMSARDYVTLVLGGIGRETDSSVVSTLLRQVTSALLLYVAPEHRSATRTRLADGLLDLLRAAAPGSDAQLQFARAFAGLARSREHLAVVRGLLDGTGELPGLTVDTDLRWHLLHELVAAGVLDEDAIASELSRDHTALGEQNAASARAARPSAAAKAEAWASVVERDDLANALQTAVIAGFAEPGQEDLVRPYVTKYFAALEPVWATRTHEMAKNIVVGLYPTLLAEEATLRAADEWLASTDPVPALRRLVLEARDGTARALRAQARDR